MDRKPPTLLKSVPLARIQSSIRGGPLDRSIPHLLLVPSSSTIFAIPPSTSESPHVHPLALSLPILLMGDPNGMSTLPSTAPDETQAVHLQSDIRSFVRTPNGRGLLAISESGEIGVWAKHQRGRPKRGVKQAKTLLGRGQWTRDPAAPSDLCAIFAKGRAIVAYSHPPSGSGQISLQHLDMDATSPTPSIPLPDFHLPEGEAIKMILAVSDIDDGMSAAGRRTERAVIMAASGAGEAWAWSVISRRISADEADPMPEIKLLSRYTLPIEPGSNGERGRPRLILPVDPMGWHQSTVDWKSDTPLQDMVLTISDAGVLEFWRPRLAMLLGGAKDGKKEAAWTRTGVVHTDITDICMARCSSRKKTVLVRVGKGGEQEITIWDSNVSEFSTGLELTKAYG